jgi:hypothetical protein
MEHELRGCAEQRGRTVEDMDVTALVLAVVALLVALVALGVAASVRMREPRRRYFDDRHYSDHPYWPSEGRPGPFPGPSGDGAPPWQGGPRV